MDVKKPPKIYFTKRITDKQRRVYVQKVMNLKLRALCPQLFLTFGYTPKTQIYLAYNLRVYRSQKTRFSFFQNNYDIGKLSILILIVFLFVSAAKMLTLKGRSHKGEVIKGK